MGASNVYRRRFYSYIPRLTMPATPRFKLDDSVNKKRTSGMYTAIGPTVGKIVEMNYIIKEGDRVEVYHKASQDPKIARVKRVKSKKKLKS